MKWNNYKDKNPYDGQWCIVRENWSYSFCRFFSDKLVGDYFKRDYDEYERSTIIMEHHADSDILWTDGDAAMELLLDDGDEAIRELEKP